MDEVNKVQKPLLVIIMGISGTGKSTLAKSIAMANDFLFIEADDYHDKQSIGLMMSGKSIGNKRREAFFRRLLAELEKHYAKGHRMVLAFSGIKKHHRLCLSAKFQPAHLFWLDCPNNLLSERLEARQGHFANTSFLMSQLNDLDSIDVKEDVFKLSSAKPTKQLTSDVNKYLSEVEEC